MDEDQLIRCSGSAPKRLSPVVPLRQASSTKAQIRITSAEKSSTKPISPKEGYWSRQNAASDDSAFGARTKIRSHHQLLSRSCRRFSVTATPETKSSTSTRNHATAPAMASGEVGQGVGPPFS